MEDVEKRHLARLRERMRRRSGRSHPPTTRTKETLVQTRPSKHGNTMLDLVALFQPFLGSPAIEGVAKSENESERSHFETQLPGIVCSVRRI